MRTKRNFPIVQWHSWIRHKHLGIGVTICPDALLHASGTTLLSRILIKYFVEEVDGIIIAQRIDCNTVITQRFMFLGLV